MYSYEERVKAVELYVKCGLRASVVMRELGYPSKNTLKAWYREFSHTGRIKSSQERRPRYTEKQRKLAIAHYLSTGKSISFTIRVLGYPSKDLLLKWIREDLPGERDKVISSSGLKCFSNEQKIRAVLKSCDLSTSVSELSKNIGVSRETIYHWKRQFLTEGGSITMSKKREQSSSKEQKNLSKMSSILEELETIRKEVEELEAQKHQLQLEVDVLKMTAEIIKKEQGVNPQDQRNSEKAAMIDALRQKYSLKELLEIFSIAKSSYCYQQRVRRAGDRYAVLREKIREIFESAQGRYGYRRIHMKLKRLNIAISEKVIRKIMREESLHVSRKKRRKYNSYRGEISAPVPNIIQRDFSANKPNTKWLSDITEFNLPTGKVYLSPIIDCFNGLPVSWSIGTSPDADLVNSMLDEAIVQLSADEKPIVHTDRGCHYQWPGWIQRMEAADLTRSMSKKGCSPDNSACEGFFGIVKNELFYNKNWTGVSVIEFISQLNDYLHWYCKDRIKLSLGGMSPLEYRQSLGLLA